MECESSGPFITSVIELKLDTTTMFEWQKHSQVATSVPHYQELLDFINLWVQASETSTTKSPKGELKKNFHVGKPLPSFVTTTNNSETPVCVLCKPEKHLLFNCIKFKELPHKDKLSVLKTHNQCTIVSELVITHVSVNLYIIARNVMDNITLCCTMILAKITVLETNNQIQLILTSPWVSSHNHF